MMTFTRTLAVVASSLLVAAPLQAATCSQTSPAHRVALVELYTSEGCSSCPPADRWLARLAADPAQAGRSVALALHVDYWDSLGWTDAFAQHAFTLRQHQLAALAHAPLVYTPEVFVNGREFRNWDSTSAFNTALSAITPQAAQERITLRLHSPNPRTLNLDASFEPVPETPSGARPQAGSQAGLQAYVALYENDLTRAIGAGENRGATLHHTHVVRRWIGPIALASGQGRLQTSVQLETGWNTAHLGVAAFVESSADGDVLQATALPACVTP
jgi:hypothetical protein